MYIACKCVIANACTVRARQYVSDMLALSPAVLLADFSAILILAGLLLRGTSFLRCTGEKTLVDYSLL